MRIRMGALALFSMLSAAAVSATPSGASLTLQEAVARVLDRNPQLQAADFDSRAAAERIRQQRQTTPYEVSVDLENVVGSGAISGTRSLETTLSLGRVLELGGKATRRGEVAQLEAGLLRHDLDAQRLDLLAETARRYLALVRAQAERELAQRRVGLLQQTLKSVQQRYRLGKAPAAERSRVQIDLARAELALEETDHLLRDGRRQLAILWGDFDADFELAQAQPFELQPDADFAELDRALERNPVLARLATSARLAEARQVLARARSRPDLNLSAGIRHLNAADDVGLVLSLRMPLGSAGRSGAYVNEATYLAAREPLLAQDQRLALRATLFSLHQELVHARDRFEVYEQRILPAAEQALNDYNQGYAVGRYSLLELSAAQHDLLEARVEFLSAAVDHHAAHIEIDRLIGVTPVIGETP